MRSGMRLFGMAAMLGLLACAPVSAQEKSTPAESVPVPQSAMPEGSSPMVGAGGQAVPRRPQPPIEDLGDGRYRIGAIMVDKPARQFTVPGRVIHLEDILEYVAVTRGGMKEYESLLELDSSATEFQLACILIGLDESKSVKPRYQFDENDAIGQPVAIDLSFEREGKNRSVPVANALLSGDKPFDDHRWVYIGSITEQTGEFMAESIGTLIGFVHDPFAIIEHRKGAGIGEYGLIKANTALLPPVGAPVTVSVRAIAE